MFKKLVVHQNEYLEAEKITDNILNMTQTEALGMQFRDRGLD